MGSEMSDVEQKLAESSARWQYVIWTVMLVIGLVAGALIGIWITRSGSVDEAPSPLAGPHPPGPAPLTPQAESAYLRTSGAARGPYRFRFSEGQIRHYGIDAEIEGKGWDLGQEGEIYLRFGSTFSLLTKSVDDTGIADLRLVFESADLNGSFLDSPFEMSLDVSGVRTVEGGRASPVESRQPPPAGSPLDFLRTPVEMKIAPSGSVLDVRGPTGLRNVLALLPTVARVEFPDEEMREGKRWETRLALPVPALGKPLETRVINTFKGYQRVQDRYCAVVEQVLDGVQTAGTAATSDPSGAGAAAFSAPLFELTGQNTVYFDVNDPCLVHATLDLNLAVNFGQALGDATALVQTLGRSLLSPNGKELEDQIIEDGVEDLLDINVSIDGAVSLLDDAALPGSQ
ncbi:MAG: hypothetical protein AMXMBFR4_15820 [Candidatus Hydrogenedentota bacterium]